MASVENTATREQTAPATGAAPLPVGFRLSLMALGYLPLLHVLAVAACVAWPLAGRAPGGALALAPAALYLLPPLASAVGRLVFPVPDGRFPVPSREFVAWWFHAQCQMMFNRLPALEEILRLVPGLYSLWLRLWGARVGPLVYWSPGVRILDRPLLRVGARAVLGAGVRINPHVVAPDGDGRMTLSVAPVAIGDDALIGGYGLLTAGCRVAPGSATPALLALPPFSEWEAGRRARPPREAARAARDGVGLKVQDSSSNAQ